MCHDSSNNQEWGLANDLLPDHLGRTIHHRGAHVVMDATGRARPSRERTDDDRGLATGGILLGRDRAAPGASPVRSHRVHNLERGQEEQLT